MGHIGRRTARTPRRHARSRGLVVAALVVLSACGGGDDDDSVADERADEPAAAAGEPVAAEPTAIAPFGVVTIEEGAAINEFDSVTLIDVRTPGEFAEGHIEGAELVDLNSGEFPAAIGEYDPDGQYLIYCRSGNRSAQAAAIMADLGFGQVWDMGGIIDWEAAGFPVVE